MPRRLGQQRVRLLDERRALGLLLADRQQRHARGQPRRGGRRRTPRPSGRTAAAWPPCTRRWRRHRAAQRDATPSWGMGVAMAGRVDPFEPSHAQQSARHRRAGVPGAHHGQRPCRRAPPRRRAPGGVFLRRRTEGPGSSSMAMTSDAGRTSSPRSVPRRSGGPTSTTGMPCSVDRLTGPGDDLVGGVVAAHGVHRHREPGGLSRLGPRPGPCH